MSGSQQIAYRVESSAAGRRGEHSSAHYYLELLQSNLHSTDSKPTVLQTAREHAADHADFGAHSAHAAH